MKQSNINIKQSKEIQNKAITIANKAKQYETKGYMATTKDSNNKQRQQQTTTTNIMK